MNGWSRVCGMPSEPVQRPVLLGGIDKTLSNITAVLDQHQVAAARSSRRRVRR
jgi:hypothetical protein